MSVSPWAKENREALDDPPPGSTASQIIHFLPYLSCLYLYLLHTLRPYCFPIPFICLSYCHSFPLFPPSSSVKTFPLPHFTVLSSFHLFISFLVFSHTDFPCHLFALSIIIHLPFPSSLFFTLKHLPLPHSSTPLSLSYIHLLPSSLPTSFPISFICPSSFLSTYSKNGKRPFTLLQS
jgi:hypothetical protein